MTTSPAFYARFSRAYVANAQGTSQSRAAKISSFQSMLDQGNSVSMPRSNASSARSSTASVTQSDAASPTQGSTAAMPGTMDSAGGRLPVLIPSPPELPVVPPSKHDITAPRVFDPATGTYAPRGYNSWAEHGERMAAIKTRNKLMHGHFEDVLAVLKQIDALFATPPASGDSSALAQKTTKS